MTPLASELFQGMLKADGSLLGGATPFLSSSFFGLFGTLKM